MFRRERKVDHMTGKVRKIYKLDEIALIVVGNKFTRNSFKKVLYITLALSS